MAQGGSVTPEKQLLNLIEGSKEKSGSAVEARAVKRRGLSFFSLSAWSARGSFFSARLAGKLRSVSFFRIEIKAVNRVLWLGVLILSIYFISNITVSLANINRIPDFNVQLQEASGAGYLDSASALKNTATYYIDKVSNRDIFKIVLKKAVSDEPLSAPRAPTSRVIAATEHLKLVGIAWSREPDAMIEDTKSKRTFFLKRGQAIGDVRVEAISRDKVILSYAGEEVELR